VEDWGSAPGGCKSRSLISPGARRGAPILSPAGDRAVTPLEPPASDDRLGVDDVFID